MPYSIHVFSEDHTTPAGLLARLPPVEDPAIRTQGNFMYLKHLLHLFGVTGYGGAAFAPTRMWIDSPELRKLNYFEVTPLEQALLPAEAIDFRIQPQDPIELPKGEAIGCYLEGAAGAVGWVSACVWLSDGPITPVHGSIHHIRMTAAITAAIGTWESGEMVYEQPLPKGTYQIVGARCQPDVGEAYFRFINLEESARPGGLCVADVECPDLREQRNGGLGVWMEFEEDSPPELEIWSTVGGGAAQEVTLDIIKVA